MLVETSKEQLPKTLGRLDRVRCAANLPGEVVRHNCAFWLINIERHGWDARIQLGERYADSIDMLNDLAIQLKAEVKELRQNGT